ncbi:MAG TPA: hypothetical protein VN950_17525 [Terriglobales bacterium]|nr:hypothetical protein [Terriglobales bacterium]
MVFEKAAYWMAVGVLALLVSNHLAGRYEDGARRLASQSLAAVEQVSGQATRVMATAEMMLGGGQVRFVRAQNAMACAQTRLASVETVLASHEAALAKVQAERAQLMDLQQLRGTIMCPRQNLRMVMPQLHGGGTI